MLSKSAVSATTVVIFLICSSWLRFVSMLISVRDWRVSYVALHAGTLPFKFSGLKGPGAAINFRLASTYRGHSTADDQVMVIHDLLGAANC
jgi:hypothetical protein